MLETEEIDRGMCQGDWRPILANWEHGVIVAVSDELPNNYQIFKFFNGEMDYSKMNWKRGTHWRCVAIVSKFELETWKIAASVLEKSND